MFFGFNWFEFFFGVKQCGVDIVWAGWDVYLLFKNVPWSKCIWPEWVCMLDLIKQLLFLCWCIVFDSCMAHPVDSKAANQFSSLLEACQRSRAIFWLCKTLLGCRLTIDTTREFWKISKSGLHGQLWTSVTFYVHLLWCSLTSILNEAPLKLY